MLIRYDKKLNIEKAGLISKILQLSLAQNQTIVALVVPKNKTKEETVIHFDHDGSIIHEYTFDTSVNMFAMTTQNEVIVPLVKKNILCAINLDKKEVVTIAFQFMMDNDDSLEIYTFWQSKMVCLKESQNESSSELALTYFGFPFQENSQAVAFYHSEKEQFDVVQKVNNHSLIVWNKRKAKNKLILNMNEVKFDEDETICIFKTIQVDVNPLKIFDLKFRADALWEIRKGELAIIGIPTNDIRQRISREQQETIFILDMDKQILRDSCIKLPKGGTMTGEVQFLDEYIVIQTFELDKKGINSVFLYFINNCQQKIELSDKCEVEALSQLNVSGSDCSMLLESSYLNYEPKEIAVTMRKPIQVRQIFLRLLLHLNSEFDDDLLQDSLQILNCL